MFGRITGLIDDLLIGLMLAVTVAHVSHFLGHFESPGLKWISIPQAIAMDGAIARSGYLYRIYKGQKQRQWALTGLLFFSACSVVFNYGYYIRQGAGALEGLALASLFPVAVALLSYLKGQKAVSDQRRATRSQPQHPTRSLSDRDKTVIDKFESDPTMSLSVLGRDLRVSKTTASRLVSRLIAAGYLKRVGQEVHVQREPSDRQE